MLEYFNINFEILKALSQDIKTLAFIILKIYTFILTEKPLNVV